MTLTKSEHGKARLAYEKGESRFLCPYPALSKVSNKTGKVK